MGAWLCIQTARRTSCPFQLLKQKLFWKLKNKSERGCRLQIRWPRPTGHSTPPNPPESENVEKCFRSCMNVVSHATMKETSLSFSKDGRNVIRPESIVAIGSISRVNLFNLCVKPHP